MPALTGITIGSIAPNEPIDPNRTSYTFNVPYATTTVDGVTVFPHAEIVVTKAHSSDRAGNDDKVPGAEEYGYLATFRIGLGYHMVPLTNARSSNPQTADLTLQPMRNSQMYFDFTVENETSGITRTYNITINLVSN